MKNFLISLFLVLFATASYASHEFKDVEDYTYTLLKTVPPENILFLSDFDGTITGHSHPALNDGDAVPRENAPAFLKDMVDRGVKVVLSSAWDPFEETVQRVMQLKLTQTLKITKPEYNECDLKFANKLEITVNYALSGLVCSVKEQEKRKSKDPFFRNKAFAHKLVYPQLKEEDILHVIVAEDSKTNIDIIMADIERAGLFTSAKVKIFHLSEVPAKEEKK